MAATFGARQVTSWTSWIAAQHAHACAGQTAEEQQQLREHNAAKPAQARAARAAAAEQPQPPVVVSPVRIGGPKCTKNAKTLNPKP